MLRVAYPKWPLTDRLQRSTEFGVRALFVLVCVTSPLAIEPIHRMSRLMRRLIFALPLTMLRLAPPLTQLGFRIGRLTIVRVVP